MGDAMSVPLTEQYAGRVVRIGLIGFGTVGTAVYRLLQQNAELIRRQTGLDLRITRIAVRNVTKFRPISPPSGLLTDQPELVTDDPDIQIVVEVAGGGGMKYWIMRAIAQGKAVVTANKECISQFGPELFRLATAKKVDLRFEGSVGGAIPILRPLKETLTLGRIRQITGILNGTTNYILTQMAREGKGFDEALAQAQRSGYAETDPSLDLDGIDAAYKLAILSSIGFHGQITLSDVQTQGIRSVRPEDIAYGLKRGWSLKLLAHAVCTGDLFEARVQPTFLPYQHPLAHVEDEYNAILVSSAEAGELTFCGPGAGGMPSAAAVIGDIAAAASNHVQGVSSDRLPPDLPLVRQYPSALRLRYYLRIRLANAAKDGPLVHGWLVQRTGHSVTHVDESLYQSGGTDLVIETEPMEEQALNQLQEAIRHSPLVGQIMATIPILGS
jgi:homoserine dehydrogenase